MLDERLGKLNFWTMLIGFNLTFFPMHFLGLLGMPRRTYRYDTGMGWDILNQLETVGAFVIASRVLVFLVNVISSRKRGEARRATTRGTAGRSSGRSRRRRPSTTSPRSRRSRRATTGGTASTPRTTRAERVCALPSGAGGRGRGTRRGDRDGDRTGRRHGDGHGIHMPSPSYYPLIVALGLPDPRLRGRVPEPCGSSRRRPAGLLFGIYAWGIEPGTEDGADRPWTRSPSRAAHERRRSTATTPTPPRTGVTNTKLAMWLFLSSDCLFFGAFISTYLLYRGRAQPGPTPADVYNIPFTSVTSFILLMSSLTMVLALAAIQRGDYRRFRVWLHGHGAVRRDVHRRSGLRVHRVLPRGLSLDTNLFGLDVLRAHRPPRRPRDGRDHLAAVAVGPGRCRAACTSRDSERVEIAGLYWHFVDVVWIVIFTVVYLIPK